MALNKVEICGVNTAKLPLLKEEEKEEKKEAKVVPAEGSGEQALQWTRLWPLLF